MNSITPFAVWDEVMYSDDTSGEVATLSGNPTPDGKAFTILFDAHIRLELQPKDDLLKMERSVTVKTRATLQESPSRWLLKNDFRYLLDKEGDVFLEMLIGTNKGTQVKLSTTNASDNGDLIAFYLPAATNNEICFNLKIKITRKRTQEVVIFDLASLDLILEEVKPLAATNARK